MIMKITKWLSLTVTTFMISSWAVIWFVLVYPNSKFGEVVKHSHIFERINNLPMFATMVATSLLILLMDKLFNEYMEKTGNE